MIGNMTTDKSLLELRIIDLTFSLKRDRFEEKAPAIGNKFTATPKQKSLLLT